jgi:hypothetical protein
VQSKAKFAKHNNLVKGTVIVAGTGASSAEDLVGLASNPEARNPQVSAWATA